MELRHLRYFVAVAEHGNFNRASGKLHLSQPALSRQVRDLEEEIGVPLFHRNTNSTTLSKAGEIFYDEARDILARTERAVQRVRGEVTIDILRIGYAPSLTANIFADALKRFHSERPRVRVELADMTDREIVEQFSAGSLDLALTAIGVGAAFRAAQWVEIARIAPSVILPVSHPLARFKRIAPAQLRDLPLVGLDRASHPEYHRLLRAILKPHGVTPRVVTPADGMASLFNALTAESAVAVLPASVASLLPASLTLRPFSPALEETILGAGTPAGKNNSNAELFIKLLRNRD
jgi:LysR family transcriptional regulator, benzoate and cis,cis-muconate-responsive activator of ben and cat genes